MTAEKSFDAFVSYSHQLDAPLADGLVEGLHGFAKPWYRVRALHVFRDKSCLAVQPLWESIQHALDDARTLVLLASPEAASSAWVARETDYWCGHNPPWTLLLVLTAGDIVWDEAASDFDWSRTNALPPTLGKRFSSEPLYVDLRWARGTGSQARHDGRFTDAVATLAATLHGRPKDDLVGEDIRRHRSAVRLARAVGAILAILALTAASAAFMAVQQRNTAREQQRLALSRQLAAQSVAALDTRVDTALLLGIEAYRTAPTTEARGALLSANESSGWFTRVLVGHQSAVTAITASADGRYIASGDSSGIVLLWDQETDGGMPLEMSGHHAAIRALAFDPSGGTLVSADSAAEVIRWNINGDRQSSLELDGTPLAFDPTTQRLAIGRVNRIDVVDTATGAPTMLSVTTANPVQSSGAAFSPNGLVLAVGLDSQVTLWDVTSGLQEGKGLRSTGSAPVEAVAFTEDGDRLVGKDLDGFVCTWDVSTSSVIACLDVGGGPYQLATGPDARTATSGDLRSVEVLDNTTGESWGAMYGSGSNVSAISFGAEKGQIISGDADGLVIVWDLYAGSGLMQAFGHVPSSVDDSMSELSWASVPVAFSPDGRHMAVAGPQETAVWEARVRSSTGEVTWGTVANVAVALDSPGDAVAFAPDGETLVTASNETGVVQWDANTGEKVGEALVEPNEPSKDAVTYGLAVTPDGLTLIEAEAPSVGDGNLRIRTWDAGTGSLRDEESAASVHDLTTMVLAATNSTVAYSTGTEVALEDLTTHRVLHTIDAGGDVQALAVSPDGRMLATIVGRRVRLWDVGSAEQLGELAGHGEDMMSVAFSADGTMLATGAFDASFSLWDVATRRQIGPSLIAPASIIRSVGFVADDNMLAAVGEDVMFSYDLNVDRWLERACAVANHNLTEAEWEQYLPTAKYRITCPDVVTGESP